MDSRTYELPTSITLDYRSGRWGLERIVLDGISNHLPADSKGNEVTVTFVKGSRSYTLKEARTLGDDIFPVTQIIFADDGQGYSAERLSLLHSTKTADAMSVGQWGEGLKLVAAAALRANETLEYRSRNWVAQPFAETLTVDEDKLNRLCFRITENGETIEGSRTVFNAPSPDLVKQALSLPEKVLALNDTYTELHSAKDAAVSTGKYEIAIKDFEDVDWNKLAAVWSQGLGKTALINGSSAFKRKKYYSRIIDLHTDEPAIFIKGVRMQDANGLFSYDLGINDIAPDRMFANLEVVREAISNLLKRCANTEVIARVLELGNASPYGHHQELQAFAPAFKTQRSRNGLLMSEKIQEEIFPSYREDVSAEPGLWATTFNKLFGENAVLAAESDDDRDAEFVGFKPVKMNPDLRRYLEADGAKSSTSVASVMNKEYRWLSMDDLTLQEQEVLSHTPAILAYLGIDDTAPQPRVYSGLFTPSGREMPSNVGVHISMPNGTTLIGVKRSELASLEQFAHTYIHEYGHEATKVGDYHRDFTDFFIKALTRKCVEGIKK